MYNPELQSRIAMWKAKCQDGTMTTEEYVEAVALLRQGRLAAASAAARSKSKAKPAVDSDALLGDLDSL